MTYTITGTIDGYPFAFATPSMKRAAARWAELIEHPGNDLVWMDQYGRLLASSTPVAARQNKAPAS